MTDRDLIEIIRAVTSLARAYEIFQGKPESNIIRIQQALTDALRTLDTHETVHLEFRKSLIMDPRP